MNQECPYVCCAACGELIWSWPSSWNGISREGCTKALAEVYGKDDVVIRELEGLGERLRQSRTADSLEERRVIEILLNNMEYLPQHMRCQFLENWEGSVMQMRLAERIKKLATVNKGFAQKSAPLIARLLELEDELKAEEYRKILTKGMALLSESAKEELRQIFDFNNVDLTEDD